MAWSLFEACHARSADSAFGNCRSFGKTDATLLRRALGRRPCRTASHPLPEQGGHSAPAPHEYTFRDRQPCRRGQLVHRPRHSPLRLKDRPGAPHQAPREPGEQRMADAFVRTPKCNYVRVSLLLVGNRHRAAVRMARPLQSRASPSHPRLQISTRVLSKSQLVRICPEFGERQ
jgi:hypothetical protein